MLKFRFLKIWIAAFLIFSGFRPAYAQRPVQILFSEVHTLPGDSGNTVYYSYKVPFSNLVFEKKGNSYSSNFRILVEVTDSSKNFITRQISEESPSARDFDQTNSGEMFYEGLFTFTLSPGKYFLNPVFTDINSGKEIKLEPIYLAFPEGGNFLKPVILTSDLFSCSSQTFHALSNFNENFPFDEKEYEFIIPSPDTSISNIYLLIINNRDTVFDGSAGSGLLSSLRFFECGGKILASEKDQSKALKLFKVKTGTKDLIEGSLTIFASKEPFNGKSKPERIYNRQVSWYNKPFSLANPETAIKMLKYLEKDSVINRLLSHKEDDYLKQLFLYWKKYDPSPQTAFNPLMLEYYSRLDYAQKNFSTISGTKGVDSDRGMVLIKFGQPTKIERMSDEHGKIVETWSYEKLQKRFVFVDRQGTGEFLLRNG